MYKNIEDKREAGRKWYKKHRIEVLKKCVLRDKRYREKYPEKILKRNRSYRKKNPWMKTLFSIYKRVRGKEAKRRYFDRGIKNFLTPEDLKRLWFKDKAYRMKKPSIHRKDNDGDYKLSNCEYIEFGKHSRLHRMQERNK